MPEKGKTDFRKQGKRNRQRGAIFESRVREDLMKMGWIVDKWSNTVDFEKDGKIGKIIPAKRKYNPFLRALSIGTGFPDFICFKREGDKFDIMGVEVKMNGGLDKKERGICIWLLQNKIFSKILIAKKVKIKNRITIEYSDFDIKYPNKA